MLKKRERTSFKHFGHDVRQAREAMKLSRKELAVRASIDPRYLANIENNGLLPSLPIFFALVTICGLPVEKYFYPQRSKHKSIERERTERKLSICPEKYLPIVEAVLDGTIHLDK